MHLLQIPQRELNYHELIDTARKVRSDRLSDVLFASMDVNGDEIASVVLDSFHRLPKKRKPQIRGDGSQEWTPLSGIVVQGKSLYKQVVYTTDHALLDKLGLVCVVLGYVQSLLLMGDPTLHREPGC